MAAVGNVVRSGLKWLDVGSGQVFQLAPPASHSVHHPPNRVCPPPTMSPPPPLPITTLWELYRKFVVGAILSFVKSSIQMSRCFMVATHRADPLG